MRSPKGHPGTDLSLLQPGQSPPKHILFTLKHGACTRMRARPNSCVCVQDPACKGYGSAGEHGTQGLVCKGYGWAIDVCCTHLLCRVILARHQDGQVILARVFAIALTEHVFGQVELFLRWGRQGAQGQAIVSGLNMRLTLWGGWYSGAGTPERQHDHGKDRLSEEAGIEKRESLASDPQRIGRCSRR